MFSCEFCEISKSTFFHRTRLMAASGVSNYLSALQEPCLECSEEVYADININIYQKTFL